MKHTLFLMLMLFPYNILYGQIHNDSISETELECKYKYLQANAREGLFLLKYGKQVSQFYGLESMRYDSLRANGGEDISSREWKEKIDRRKAAGIKIDKRDITINKEIIYRNLRKGKLTYYNNNLNKYVTYDEDLPSMEWKIMEDSVKTILGYDCHLAVTTFRGRQWQAWFTFDIPISVGPWKLCDLPGLILEASVEGYALFVAISLQTNVGRPILFYNYADRKYKSVSRKELLELKKQPFIVPFKNIRIDPYPYIELE